MELCYNDFRISARSYETLILADLHRKENGKVLRQRKRGNLVKTEVGPLHNDYVRKVDANTGRKPLTQVDERLFKSLKEKSL